MVKKRLFELPQDPRYYGKLLIDFSIFILAYYVSFLIRFEGNIPLKEFQTFLKTTPIVVLVYSLSFIFFGLHKTIWRYSSISDLRKLIGAISSGMFVIILVVLSLEEYVIKFGYPRSIFFIDPLVMIALSGGVRFFYRIIRKERYRINSINASKKRVLIVGAGDAGAAIASDILKNAIEEYSIVGFVDDNPLKKGSTISGVPIIGKVDDISDIAQKENIDQILISISKATAKEMSHIINRCKSSAKDVRILPSIKDILEGKVSRKDFREIKLEDLLNRDIIDLDTKSIKDYIKNKVVMITGAAGSVGSELAKQIADYGPKELILYDRAETNLYFMDLTLKNIHRNLKLISIMADINNIPILEGVFKEFKPQLIFHAAAYKHVPMTEANPIETILDNVGGSKNLAILADQYKVDKFIMISTDKAVEPVNVMGATKRICELLMMAINEVSNTKFINIRFGNILGSSGSVVSVFKSELQRGEPLTITSPEAERFFMTIGEAIGLVLQASVLGKGGETFVLDMGQPIKILDLAKHVIRLSGLEPDKDVEIKFTGLRNGDKLKEKLFSDSERIVGTKYKKLNIAEGEKGDYNLLIKNIDILIELAKKNRKAEAIDKLKEIVPDHNGE